MQSFIPFYLSAGSILLPLLAAVWRRDRIGPDYVPLVVLLAVGAANEGLSLVFAFTMGTNLLNGNIYVLIEFVLIAWQFRRFKPIGNRKALHMLVVVALCFWVLDNLILHSLFNNNSLFRMSGSLLILCTSIDRLNLLLFFNSPSPLKTPDILICSGLLIYHLYKTFVEAFHVFPIPMHKSFYQHLWLIMCFVNILMHLIFSLAFLWLPKKQSSIQLS